MSGRAHSGAVLVTGAGGGIGAASAVLLARRGYRVYGGVRRSADEPALRAAGVVPLRLDVTDPEQIDDAVAAIRGDVGDDGVAGLVNNAGIVVGGPIELADLDALRHVLEVNVVGAVAVTQRMLPLVRRRGGRVVTVGSVAGRVAVPALGPYAASKFALEAVHDALRRELTGQGVRVVVVEPGAVATPLWDKVAAGLVEPAGGPYRDLVRGIRSVAGHSGDAGMPATRVARVVARAFTATRPRARYLVGADARAHVALVRLLPSRIFDARLAGSIRRAGAMTADAGPAPAGLREAG